MCAGEVRGELRRREAIYAHWSVIFGGRARTEVATQADLARKQVRQRTSLRVWPRNGSPKREQARALPDAACLAASAVTIFDMTSPVRNMHQM